ncbi:tetratricopeptide repeat protein [Muricoccus radiodurans]|uniref:tetratricopeptide repeat protein n=1 Tax=Muricoccus radiodurans TaxID=2231721 RepID=UPI003CF6FD3D
MLRPSARPLARVSATLLAAALLALPATRAQAQAESREGIYLQNQILQLRQEMYEALRRGGGAAPQLPPPGRGGYQGGGAELIPQLLERIGALEEEVRRQRGLAEQAEFRNRRLQEDVEKLRGDLDYRFSQLEQRGGGAPSGPPPGPGPSGGRREGGQQQGTLTPPDISSPAIPAPPPGTPSQPAPRTPEVALREGQAALGRGDHAAAETAAREVLAARSTPRAQDAGILLGDALMGKRDFQNAAIAYDDAYRRNRSAARAPVALVGLANAFAGFGARREACDTLQTLNSEFPRLPANIAERVGAARARAGCR